MTSKEAIKNISFSCERGHEDRIQRWSETGYSRGCYKDKSLHGRWVAWEGSFMNIEGRYNNGLKDGEWLIFDNNGQVYRKISYEKGIEKENVIVSKL